MATTSSLRQHTAVVEYDGGAWIAVHVNGDVRGYSTARQALRAIAARAKRGNVTVTITSIQWRNVPAGFVPPTHDNE